MTRHQYDDIMTEIPITNWHVQHPDEQWAHDLESGKVLFFPALPFALTQAEKSLLAPDIIAPKTRNISLDDEGHLKGAIGEAAMLDALAGMIGRFRTQAITLIETLLPKYCHHLHVAPTSFRPLQVSNRKQSRRANDRLLHVDSFPSRPNYGERILRVFANINPKGESRIWRVGEPFDTMAHAMLPQARRYVRWQANLINRLGITKSFRSEYDHLMLQLHDCMKADENYQRRVPQTRLCFPPGSVWVCFSDQVTHAVESGQFMLEQSLHLPVSYQYDPGNSPLHILRQLTNRPLTNPLYS